jgi:hypothetical protein
MLGTRYYPVALFEGCIRDRLCTSLIHMMEVLESWMISLHGVAEGVDWSMLCRDMYDLIVFETFTLHQQVLSFSY